MIPSQERLTEIAKHIQGIMRIQDWDITIEIVNNREMDSIAKCNYVPGGYCNRNRYYKTANIYINRDSDEREWYFVLIHELYHVVLEDMDNFWDNDVRRHVDKKEIERLENAHEFFMEKLICDLTRQFCSLYPATNFTKEGD